MSQNVHIFWRTSNGAITLKCTIPWAWMEENRYLCVASVLREQLMKSSAYSADNAQSFFASLYNILPSFSTFPNC